MSSSKKTKRRTETRGILRETSKGKRLDLASGLRYNSRPDTTGDYGVWDNFTHQFICLGLNQAEAEETAKGKNDEREKALKEFL